METDARRRRVVQRLLDGLQDVQRSRPALIALDGFDGAGKTHLAAELMAARTPEHRPMTSLSIDHFHRPKADRIAAGTDAEGFYRGSYRYSEFRECVIAPLRAGLPVIPAVWDVANDQPIGADPVQVAPDEIVIVDGIFLQRPELADAWDATIWVDAPFEITVPRGNARFPGTHDPDPEALANQRYVGGQRLYLAEANPVAQSTWLFDNRDLSDPTLTRQRP